VTDIPKDIKHGRFTRPAVSSNIELALEWDTEANGDLNPDEITLGSGKKVHWVCVNDHRWTARVIDRARGRGCVKCLHSHPEASRISDVLYLMAEWDTEANRDVHPDDVACLSNTTVGWICEKGHRWTASIGDRYVRGHGCPVCLGRRVTEDNCLATIRPDLVGEWSSTKNGNLTPSDVTAKSNRKVFWVCSEGHQWQARIDHRTLGRACPQCSRAHRGQARRVA